MQIYLPYTVILPATSECLEPYTHCKVEMKDDEAYIRYFQDRWREGESFINCEHDTIFHNGAIEELMECPEEWCAFGEVGNDVIWTQGEGPETLPLKRFVDGGPTPLALMKFEKRFIDKHPDVWGRIPSDWKSTPKWRWLDAWLQTFMRLNGIVCHQHYPDVINACGGL